MQSDSSWEVAPERKPPPGESGEAMFRMERCGRRLVRSGGFGLAVCGEGEG